MRNRQRHHRSGEARRVVTIPIWFALIAVVVGMLAGRSAGPLVGGVIIAAGIFGWGLLAALRANKRGDTS